MTPIPQEVSCPVTMFAANAGEVLAKRYGLENGKLVKTSAGQLARGSYKKMCLCTITELAELIGGLKPNQALAYGIPKRPETQGTIASRNEAKPGELTRTRDNFKWPKGPAILFLDYDHPSGAKRVKAKALWEKIVAICPDLATAPAVIMSSASGFIFNTDSGKWRKRDGGWHIYLLVADGRDIPRAGKVLYDMSWMAGYGRFYISSAGTLLERSLFDAAVWQPERLDFAAGAICDPPLEQRRPAPLVINPDAAPFDTRRLGDVADTKKLTTIKAAARAAVADEAEKVRCQWIETQVAKRMATDTETDLSKRKENEDRLRGAYRRACEDSVLQGDFVLIPEEGARVTVSEILKQPDKWHGKRFADPLEPTYRQDNRIARADLQPDSKAIIYSYAHGGRVYRLIKSQGREPLPDELLPVAAFDFALLPDSLQAWARDICERVQCPPDFVAVGIMAGLAGVIGRKIGIRPQAQTDWTVVVNLWALVVGRPGVLKSPALEAALAPLQRLEAKANEAYKLAYNEYTKSKTVNSLRANVATKNARKALEKNPTADLLAVLAVDEVGEPTLFRYKTNDSTPASLGELLRQNPNGLLVYRDELVSLLKSLDREDQAEGRGFYLTAWNGDSSYTFDRIGRGLNLHIPSLCLSILGGTQPGRLSEYIRHAVKGGAGDDGLIQRFGMLVWPDTGGVWKDVDRWPDHDAKDRAFKVFNYLDKLDPARIGAQQDTNSEGTPEGLPFLRFTDDSLELFKEWRTDLEGRLRGGDLHPALESHFAKYRKLIPSLALILHLADKGTGTVSKKATQKAINWGVYLESHAKRAYGAVSRLEFAAAKAIIKRITKGDLCPSFSKHDICRHGWSMLSDRDQVAEALRLLVEYEWLREERSDTGGRPSKIYHVIEEKQK